METETIVIEIPFHKLSCAFKPGPVARRISPSSSRVFSLSGPSRHRVGPLRGAERNDGRWSPCGPSGHRGGPLRGDG